MKYSTIIQNNSAGLTSFIKGKLYISDNTVVLCTEDNKNLRGVCLHDEDGKIEIGDYSHEWASGLFIEFIGIITLED